MSKYEQEVSAEQRQSLCTKTETPASRFTHEVHLSRRISSLLWFQTFSPLTCERKISLLVSNSSKTHTVKQIKSTTQVSRYMSMAPNFTAASVTGKILIPPTSTDGHKALPQIFPIISVKTIFALLILRGL